MGAVIALLRMANARNGFVLGPYRSRATRAYLQVQNLRRFGYESRHLRTVQ